MKKFIAPKWQKILTEQGLIDFEALWQLKLALLDNPNTGRGRNDWSAVSLLSLQLPNGQEKRLILKRQKNHISRTPMHLLRGIPTFEKEAKNALRFKKLGIPVMELVYYAKRRRGNDIEAVILTEYLDGYTSLDQLVNQWHEQGWPNGVKRKRLIEAIAHLIRDLHAHGVQFNSLYTQHIFIQQKGNETKARLIDLEKCKWRPFGNGRRIRDLKTLHRRTEDWSRYDQLRFLKAYCGIERLNKNAEDLCMKVERNQKNKSTGI